MIVRLEAALVLWGLFTALLTFTIAEGERPEWDDFVAAGMVVATYELVFLALVVLGWLVVFGHLP